MILQIIQLLIQDGGPFLLSGLGAGGNGYFTLDVTDINNPKHLFAIE